MKQTGICPKCHTTGAIRIKAFGAASQSNIIRLSPWGMQMAHFDRFVCPGCGYIEEYVNLEEKGWQKWLEKQEDDNTLDTDFV